MSRMKQVCCLVSGVALLLAPAAAHAQVARIELHTFQSTTLTDQEFLTGKKEGKPVVLAGELRLPPGAAASPWWCWCTAPGACPGSWTTGP